MIFQWTLMITQYIKTTAIREHKVKKNAVIFIGCNSVLGLIAGIGMFA